MDTKVLWPAKEDYDDAMDALQANVRDPEIKHGTLHKDATGILRFGGAGLYATLYRVDDWMVRCFYKSKTRQPPDDILERYQHVSRFTLSQSIPALMPIVYVPDAIQVDLMDRSAPNSYVLIKTATMPFVRMKFITGPSLGTFIANHHQNKSKMAQLCRAWIQLVQDMHRMRFAHGDLDLTNILVTEERSNLVLKLIDYDNAWVPTMGNSYEQTEVGHAHFQHPAFQTRRTRLFDAQMDRFSALVMYISLLAIAAYPQLYSQKEWGADDQHRLLLSSEDYKAEMERASQPNHITWLRNAGVPALGPLLNELSGSLTERRIPRSLVELLPSDQLPDVAKRHVEQPISTVTESVEQAEEVDVVRVDWKGATRFKKEHEPLIDLSQEKVSDTTAYSPPDTTVYSPGEWNAPTVRAATSRHAEETQRQTQQFMEPDLQVEMPRSSGSRTGITVIIVLLVLIALVVLALFLFHLGPFAIHQQTSVSTRLTILVRHKQMLHSLALSTYLDKAR